MVVSKKYVIIMQNALDNKAKKKERDEKFNKRIIPNVKKKGFFDRIFG